MAAARPLTWIKPHVHLRERDFSAGQFAGCSRPRGLGRFQSRRCLIFFVDAWRPAHLSEQVRAALGEADERPAVMKFEPAEFNRASKAGYSAVRPFVAEQERAVELLNVDAAILDRFEGVRVLHQSARGLQDQRRGARRLTSSEPNLLASIQCRILPRGPIALLAPFLEVGFGAFAENPMRKSAFEPASRREGPKFLTDRTGFTKQFTRWFPVGLAWVRATELL